MLDVTDRIRAAQEVTELCVALCEAMVRAENPALEEEGVRRMAFERILAGRDRMRLAAKEPRT